MRFNSEKNEKLKAERNISFEMIIEAISEGKILSDIPHPKRKHQRVMLVEVKNDVYYVPYVENNGDIFLKTAFINRKYRQIDKNGAIMPKKKKSDPNEIKDRTVPYDSEDIEETELNELYENGEFTPVSEKRKKELAASAKKSLAEIREIKSITLRINSDILKMIRDKADEERIPYQTLMQLVLSQFAQGKIRIKI